MATPTEGRKSYSDADAPEAGTSQGVSQVRPGALNASTSKVVGNQAKKQEEAVTRQGTQRMKFVPTLPVRRKKPDDEVKKEEAPVPKPIERGRGRGRGMGRGRGAPPPRQEMTMVASGPFAMGPAMGGAAKKRVPRSNFAPAMPSGGTPISVGEGSSRPVAAPLNKGTRKKVDDDKEDIEVYSDPDEGVQIVDMDAVRTMDWMAPESLRRQRDDGQKLKKKTTEALKKIAKGKQKAKENVQEENDVGVEKDNANALDLSDSEEEEEMEDLIEDFAMDNLDMEEEDNLTRQEKLYFFQFPRPFPTFAVPAAGDVSVDSILVDEKNPSVSEKGAIADKGKKVSFASDVKGPGPDGSNVTPLTDEQDLLITADKKIDGIIGQLEVHRSGAIKMRLNNGMVMDVTAATQPSFLQHAVYINPTAKKLHVLGEVNRRFVVSPDVDKLLEEAEKAERVKAEETMEVPMATLSK
ncbi:RNA polymerase III RPC4-domain-containing protein [Hysterangium stoloniferum]|nr:RNA polymerase III RPC4-domain-containing protein [Hysterangium stoloniferum]